MWCPCVTRGEARGGVWEAPGWVPGAGLDRSFPAPRGVGSSGVQHAPASAPQLCELSGDGWA